MCAGDPTISHTSHFQGRDGGCCGKGRVSGGAHLLMTSWLLPFIPWSKVAMIIHHLVTNCHRCVECLCICPSQNSPKTLTTLWPLHKLNWDFLPWFHNPAIIIAWQCKQWWWWWLWWLKCHKKLFPIFLFIPTIPDELGFLQKYDYNKEIPWVFFN